MRRRQALPKYANLRDGEMMRAQMQPLWQWLAVRAAALIAFWAVCLEILT